MCYIVLRLVVVVPVKGYAHRVIFYNVDLMLLTCAEISVMITPLCRGDRSKVSEPSLAEPPDTDLVICDSQLPSGCLRYCSVFLLQVSFLIWLC